MKQFVRLFHDLGNTTSLSKKTQLMAEYFASSGGQDRDLALFILAGGSLKRRVTSTELRAWATELAEIPAWLFEESYHVVGDLAETISLLCSGETEQDSGTLEQWIQLIDRLADQSEAERRAEIIRSWKRLNQEESIVFNKLLTAGLRIGVSKGMVIKALAKATGLAEPTLAERLAGTLSREKVSYQKLLKEKSESISLTPYPFYLAYPLDAGPDALGDPLDWSAEWKWDGIRGQIVVRDAGSFAVWSRGEELLTENFPEFTPLASLLPPNTVIDGEILAWSEGKPLPFALLQKRISRKKLSAQVLRESPLVFHAYDLLEFAGSDVRSLPFEERRIRLAQIVTEVANSVLSFSAPLEFSSWEELSALRRSSRAERAEGLMLKRKSSPYQVGRRRGDWWKWKLDPLTIDGVLIYAQKGHGRRADLFTDYTFGVWQGENLIPIAKAYSGLTDEEFRRVDAFIKKNTTERFGPVRTVKPELVFEIAFEGIQASSRHKSGIALRFPRMARWRLDKPAAEADTLETVKAILQTYNEA